MADLRELELALNRVVNKVFEAGASVEAKVAANVAIDVAAETPVDTSRAQSNWQLSEHKEGGRFFFDPPVRDVSRGNKRGPAFVKVARDVNREADRLIRGKRLVRGQRILPVYIHNLTPYIRDLNRGKSRQAEAGFIESYAQKSIRRQRARFDKIMGDSLRGRDG